MGQTAMQNVSMYIDLIKSKKKELEEVFEELHELTEKLSIALRDACNEMQP